MAGLTKHFDLEILKQEIISRLKPLQPQKIILFGSYAQGNAAEDSDIDICLVYSCPAVSEYTMEIQARKRLRDLIYTYRIGFDVFCQNLYDIQNGQDVFYHQEIAQKGQIIYAQ